MQAKSIYIVGELDKDSLTKFVEDFHKADSEPESGPIFVYITSEGGEVDIGLAMYEMLRTADTPIITIGVGSVSSMAVLLMMAGDYRVMTPSSNLLIHDGSVTIQGALLAAKSHMEQNYRAHSWYCQQIAARSHRCGLSVEKVAEFASKETFIDANEALELGLIDEIQKYRKFVTIEDINALALSQPFWATSTK